MRYFYILTGIGLLIGAAIGLSEAQTVNATELGGQAVNLLFQYKVFVMYVGWWVGGGAVLGLVIDLVRLQRVDYQLTQRSNYYANLRRFPQKTEADDEAVLENIAARNKAKAQLLSQGVRPQDVDRRLSEDQRQAEADKRAARQRALRQKITATQPPEWPED